MMNSKLQSTLQEKRLEPPPKGYVAGLGRGAVGFITRSDIGPSRLIPEMPMQTLGEQPPTNYVAGAGRGAEALGRAEQIVDQEMADYSDAKYDSWAGYGGSLFNNGDYDDEDREADQIYDLVEKHMDSRRKVRREIRLKQEMQKIRSERPTIAQQFQDLKRNLSALSEDDWMNIPEIGDYSIKKVKQEKYVPVPDKVIEEARNLEQKVNYVNPNLDGTTSTIYTDGTQSSTMKITDVGLARGTILSHKLDKQLDSVSGRSNVDKKGYLTDLNSTYVNTSQDIGNNKHARLLLKSVINTNPKQASAWVAAARVEELDGKLQQARNIIGQGLQHVPDNEDLWLEAARLENPEKSKQVLAKAVSVLPKSIKLWLAAAQRETEKSMKSKILRRALEQVPNSVTLWKELIECEGEGEAKVLLYRAVECVPQQLEMWLALAKIENYKNAKEILNRAVKALPQEHSIWIHAAKLEESQGKDIAFIKRIIAKGIQVLQKHGVRIKREDWLNEAQLAEKSGNANTCHAIIQQTINIGLEEEDKEKIWLDDAEQCELKENFETARAIFQYMVDYYKQSKNTWLKAIEFERRVLLKLQIMKKQNQQKQIHTLPEEENGKTEGAELDSLLEYAMQNFNDEIFWLIAAKRQWKIGNIDKARQILQEAQEKIPKNEQLFLAQAKLEKEVGNIDQAREHLKRAREINSPKIWIRSIKLEIDQSNYEEAQKLCEVAQKQFPKYDKIWILSGELKIRQHLSNEARKIFEKGIESNKESFKLWNIYVDLEINQKNIAKARSLLEKAKVKLHQCPELWEKNIQLELINQNKQGALFLLSKALKELPNSGLLWSLAIEIEPKATRQPKIADAVKRCENDPLVMLTIGKTFWKDRKYEKAKKWFERAIALDPLNGDSYVFYWKYVKEQDGEQRAEIIKRQCLDQEIKRGQIWNKIRKSLEGKKMPVEQIFDKVVEEVDKQMSKIE